MAGYVNAGLTGMDSNTGNSASMQITEVTSSGQHRAYSVARIPPILCPSELQTSAQCVSKYKVKFVDNIQELLGMVVQY